jgi:hypothetical protein
VRRRMVRAHALTILRVNRDVQARHLLRVALSACIPAWRVPTPHDVASLFKVASVGCRRLQRS